MRNSWHKVICIGMLAAPLALSVPVHAEQAIGGTTPPTTMAVPSASLPRGEERAEHQKLREERQTLRMEHERLQSEHDTLKTQCMDAKGQERSECDAKHRVLKDKMAALHERMKALHAEKEEMHPGMQANPNHVNWNHAPSGAQPVPPSAVGGQPQLMDSQN